MAGVAVFPGDVVLGIKYRYTHPSEMAAVAVFPGMLVGTVFGGVRVHAHVYIPEYIHTCLMACIASLSQASTLTPTQVRSKTSTYT